jgi:hypothetical protein
LRKFPVFLTFFLQSFPVTYLLRICLNKLGFGELESERERGREGGSDSGYPFGGGRRFQNWQSFAKKAKKR